MKAVLFGAGDLSPGDDWVNRETEVLKTKLIQEGFEVRCHGKDPPTKTTNGCFSDVASAYLKSVTHALAGAEVLVFFAGGSIDVLLKLLVVLVACQLMAKMKIARFPTVFMIMRDQGGISSFRDHLSHLGVDQSLFNQSILPAHSATEVVNTLKTTPVMGVPA